MFWEAMVVRDLGGCPSQHTKRRRNRHCLKQAALADMLGGISLPSVAGDGTSDRAPV